MFDITVSNSQSEIAGTVKVLMAAGANPAPRMELIQVQPFSTVYPSCRLLNLDEP